MIKKQRSLVDDFKYGTMIIVLAFLVFYVVIPFIKRTNQKSFVEMVERCIELVDTKYLADHIDDNLKDGLICIDLDELIINKTNDYKGAVVIKYNSALNNIEDRYIYISNGKYTYNTFKAYKEMNRDDILDAKKVTLVYNDCSEFHQR